MIPRLRVPPHRHLMFVVAVDPERLRAYLRMPARPKGRMTGRPRTARAGFAGAGATDSAATLDLDLATA